MSGTISYNRRAQKEGVAAGGLGGHHCRYYTTERRRNRYSSFSILKWFRKSKYYEDEDSAWFRDDLRRIREAYVEQDPDYAAVTPIVARRTKPTTSAATWSKWSGSTATVYSFAYVNGADEEEPDRQQDDENDDDDGDYDSAVTVEYIDAATLPVARRRSDRGQCPPPTTTTTTTAATSNNLPPTTLNRTAAAGTMTGTRRRNKRVAPPPPVARAARPLSCVDPIKMSTTQRRTATMPRKKYRAPQPPTAAELLRQQQQQQQQQKQQQQQAAGRRAQPQQRRKKGPAPKPPVQQQQRSKPAGIATAFEPKTGLISVDSSTHGTNVKRKITQYERNRLMERVDKIEKHFLLGPKHPTTEAVADVATEKRAEKIKQKTTNNVNINNNNTGFASVATLYSAMTTTNLSELDKRAAEICRLKRLETTAQQQPSAISTDHKNAIVAAVIRKSFPTTVQAEECRKRPNVPWTSSRDKTLLPKGSRGVSSTDRYKPSTIASVETMTDVRLSVNVETAIDAKTPASVKTTTAVRSPASVKTTTAVRSPTNGKMTTAVRSPTSVKTATAVRSPTNFETATAVRSLTGIETVTDAKTPASVKMTTAVRSSTSVKTSTAVRSPTGIETVTDVKTPASVKTVTDVKTPANVEPVTNAKTPAVVANSTTATDYDEKQLVRHKRLAFFEQRATEKRKSEMTPTTTAKLSLGTQTVGSVVVARTSKSTDDRPTDVAAVADNSECSSDCKNLPSEDNNCYQQLMAMEMQSDLVLHNGPFDCAVCLCTYDNNGVVLRDCLHVFCRPCLQMTIGHSKAEQVECPYIDENYSCTGVLQHREIKKILDSDEEYERFLQRSVERARQLLAKDRNGGGSFQCRRPDCTGWCLITDKNYVFEFKCPVCGTVTCVRCGSIHERGEGCNTSKKIHENDGDTLESLIERGDAMLCPGCSIVLSKQQGCDWIKCAVCYTEICWATKGPRWGPKGKGDTTAGCMCGIPAGRKCHVNCKYCH